MIHSVSPLTPVPVKRALGTAALAAIVLGLGAGCSLPSSPVSTTANKGTDGAGATSTGSTSSAGTASAAAKVGDSITLTGNTSGERLTVTVVAVTDNAKGSDEFNTPGNSDRFYAAQFRIADVGSTAYSDAPDNSAKVIDSSGQSFSASFDTIAAGQEFLDTEQ